jgi:hypothetical protein
MKQKLRDLMRKREITLTHEEVVLCAVSSVNRVSGVDRVSTVSRLCGVSRMSRVIRVSRGR